MWQPRCALQPSVAHLLQEPFDLGDQMSTIWRSSLEKPRALTISVVENQAVRPEPNVAGRVPADVEQAVELAVAYLEQIFIQKPAAVVIGQIRRIQLGELIVAHSPSRGDSQWL